MKKIILTICFVFMLSSCIAEDETYFDEIPSEEISFENSLIDFRKSLLNNLIYLNDLPIDDACIELHNIITQIHQQDGINEIQEGMFEYDLNGIFDDICLSYDSVKDFYNLYLKHLANCKFLALPDWEVIENKYKPFNFETEKGLDSLEEIIHKGIYNPLKIEVLDLTEIDNIIGYRKTICLKDKFEAENLSVSHNNSYKDGIKIDVYKNNQYLLSFIAYKNRYYLPRNGYYVKYNLLNCKIVGNQITVNAMTDFSTKKLTGTWIVRYGKNGNNPTVKIWKHPEWQDWDIPN
jgi:hypothetical protein